MNPVHAASQPGVADPSAAPGWLSIEGLSPEEHRRVYPERWQRRLRCWPALRSAAVVVGIMLVIDLTFGGIDETDLSLGFGYLLCGFWQSIAPERPTETWILDRPTSAVRRIIQELRRRA